VDSNFGIETGDVVLRWVPRIRSNSWPLTCAARTRTTPRLLLAVDRSISLISKTYPKCMQLSASSSTMEEGKKSAHQLPFHAHPIVSSILWLLGTDVSHHREKETADERRGSLRWKDDIAEYFEQIQGASDGTTNRNEHETTVPLPKKGPQQRPIQPEEKINDNTDNRTKSPTATVCVQKSSSPNGDDSVPSPQWGFYVSITPPAADAYPKPNNDKK
jgi:hypothetical protein